MTLDILLRYFSYFQLGNITMKILIWFPFLVLGLLANDSFSNQKKVLKIEDYKSGLSGIESSENPNKEEVYYEAIKETFDLYYRDKKYENGKICNSSQTYRDIVNAHNSYETLNQTFNKNCSYIIGNLVISHLSNEDISFLNSIEEVSGHVFIFSNTLKSISLNNLKVIRGENPLLVQGKKFALVVGKNNLKTQMLEYLLMPNLQVILRHNVLFLDNPNLCYPQTKIHWDSLIGKNSQVLIVGKLVESCSTDALSCHQSCPWRSGNQFCWSNSSSDCQKINDCSIRNCSYVSKCYINENLKTEECCHDQCAGGCTGPRKTQCLACKNFNNNGVCIEYCPPLLIHDGIRYVPNPVGKLAFNHICVDKCPVKFFNEAGNCVSDCAINNTYAVNQTCMPCPNGVCPKVCLSKDILDNPNAEHLNRKMIERLQNCTVYDGNIIINTFSIEGDMFNDMPKESYGIRHSDLLKLGNLVEIYGYLKISTGHTAKWLKSLFYFKNLEIIRAEITASHKSFGLTINNNAYLLFLGLQSLKEVRNGDINIVSNHNLCLTDTLTSKSIIHKSKITIRDNLRKENCKKLSCYSECDERYGCWSPLFISCVKCKNYRIPESKQCISNCSKSKDDFDSGLINEKLEKICSKCHPQCIKQENACHGPEANQCNFGCQAFMFKGYCVPKCPIRHYSDKSSKKNCIPCHVSCTDTSDEVCNGPGDHIGENGCHKCNNALLDFNVNETVKYTNKSYVLKCLNPSDICPEGYFKFIMDFRSPDRLSRIHSILSNNSLVDQILEKWFTEYTNHKLHIGSVCLACNPLCLECNDASNWDCKRCKYFKSDNKCVDKCPENYFIENDNETKPERERRCVKCHDECNGCFGPKDFECYRCRRFKIYLNESSNMFYCNSSCDDMIQLFKDKQFVCVESLSFWKLTPKQYTIMILIFLSIVCGIFIIASLAKCCIRKTLFIDKKIKHLNEFYDTKTDTKNGTLPNMATLLLITEGQLAREEIIGSGAFGVVYRGIWQPNIDTIDKNSSFMKRNLSKFIDDPTIKLAVAVKILTDISDPANNRELLEEAKVMASVDHPCCLRILAVCLTAHPKLITQFMPLGCLLEFCQRHRALISNSNLLTWAKQIACGMEYLESKGIIHCDLAARNVLVQSPQQVKITDFGLAKMLDQSQHEYQFKGGRMPIKWLAVECMRNRVFSSKSDVWSFGVTLWEMFTFGEKPFADIKAFDILDHLEKGQRLHQPQICSIDAYTVLIQCWLADPDSRPTFSELRKTLEMMSGNPNRYLLIQNSKLSEPFYIDWDDDAQKYNDFLQALVNVSQVNSEFESGTPRSVDMKHIRSIKNIYREMRANNNCFMNNDIYESGDEMRKKSNFENPDYTSILVEDMENSNETGSLWSDYDEVKNKRMSNSTMMTNLNSNYEKIVKSPVLQVDLTEDGYLIPKKSLGKKLMCNYSYLSQVDEKTDNVIYSCENVVEKEIMLSHESSI